MPINIPSFSFYRDPDEGTSHFYNSTMNQRDPVSTDKMRNVRVYFKDIETYMNVIKPPRRQSER